MTTKNGNGDSAKIEGMETIHILEDRAAQAVWLCDGDIVAGLVMCFGLEATNDGRIRVPGGGCNKAEIALIKEYKSQILDYLGGQ